MLRKSFNENWSFSQSGSILADFMEEQGEKTNLITLPHDAMILEHRNPDCKKRNNTGFFPGGVYTYKKIFFAPDEYKDKVVFLEFEGIASNAKVFINGDFAGKCPYAYSSIYVHADRFLKYGEDNEIKVVAKSPSEPDSRWYSGGGICRNVKIMVGGLLYIAPDGVKVDTPDIEEELAMVEINTTLKYKGINTLDAFVVTELLDVDDKVVAYDKAPVTAFNGESVKVRQKMAVQTPRLWSVDHPNLYTCKTTIYANDEVVDEDINSFGIRKLQIDSINGLRINGENIKLRGACVHHDNGVVGACTFERAEERRVEIMKEAGFNAIRSAHNPMSKAMLDACDRLGMLVMDETFDMWNSCKVDYDFNLYFEEWWEYVVEDMVNKDYNHPSVILYSIGNEIPETGMKNGVALNRQIAEKVRIMDPSRYTMNSINCLVSVLDSLGELMADITGGAAPEEEPKEKEINNLMSSLHDILDEIIIHDEIGKRTAEAFSAVDVAGYNYMTARYDLDKDLFPNRVIVGSETMPPKIVENWEVIKRSTHVIGEFTWTGWDYIGESGVGKIDYALSNDNGIYGSYPWYIAYCGDMDIVGNRRPISYLREIVWGLRNEPYIAVQRPEHYKQEVIVSEWQLGDSISSWTWPGFEQKPIIAEVFSDADEVELLLNGTSIGKAAAGEKNGFRAEFEMEYAPGELVAIAYKDGSESGRYSLKTAGDDLKLKVDCDRKEINKVGGDLAYVMISLTDENGVLQTAKDRKVSVKVEGPAVLQGFGSADPMSLENFFDAERTTFDGYVLAVVRPQGETGKASVTVSADDCETRVIELNIV